MRLKNPVVSPTGDDVRGAGEHPERPTIRAHCAGGPRPCPWVGCRYHLYLTIHPGSGHITTVPDDPWDMQHTCALDVADDGPHTLDYIARIYGLTRERIRQLQDRAIRKLRGPCLARKLELPTEPGATVWEQAALNAPGSFGFTQAELYRQKPWYWKGYGR